MTQVSSRRLLAVCLAALLVASAVGAAHAAGIADSTTRFDDATGAVGVSGAADGDATEVSSCTVIDEPGRYVLAENVTDASPDDGACIEITAPNVTLDGAGHAVDGDGSAAAERGVFVHTNQSPSATQASNVTVRNLTVSDWATAGVAFSYAPDGRVTEVRADDASVRVRDSERTTITDVVVRDGDVVSQSPNVTVADSTVRDGDVSVGGFSSTGVVVVGNDVRNGSVLAGPLADSRIAGNDVTNGSVTLNDATNVTVRNNTAREVGLTNVDRVTVAGNAPGENDRFGVSILLTDGNVTVTENRITGNDRGVYAAKVGNLTVTDNRIVDNRKGIYVERVGGTLPPAAPECPRPESAVQVHGNVIANNSAYGLQYEGQGAIDATRNYWGAASGPSSPDDPDAPFVDPVTTRPADGSGDAVSERPEMAGVSNVHFDPFLPTEPSVSPAVGDDSDDGNDDGDENERGDS